ncbi:MAG: hypothetical protein M9899_06680 [Bdellovibrionaceae bacterium]|nr:hypothetical protein [Pseudobdellovibrionaceae bacterium]
MKYVLFTFIFALSNISLAQNFDNQSYHDWLINMGYKGQSVQDQILELLKDDDLQVSHNLKFLDCKGQILLMKKIKELAHKQEDIELKRQMYKYINKQGKNCIDIKNISRVYNEEYGERPKDEDFDDNYNEEIESLLKSINEEPFRPRSYEDSNSSYTVD